MKDTKLQAKLAQNPPSSMPIQNQIGVKRYEELDVVDKRIIDSMVSTFSMTKKAAIETYFDDSKWSEFNLQNQRRFQVMFASLAEPLKKVIEAKIESGSLEQAKAGMTALAIASDKWLGGSKSGIGPMFNIAGRQVQIKVQFPFRPYQKTKVIQGEEYDK